MSQDLAEILARSQQDNVIELGPMHASWCALTWTPWVPLSSDAIRRTVPTSPGVYRVRRADGEAARLVYVGQTGRNSRERLLALATGVNAGECPFNDPHTAAPHLWLLRQLERVRFECSAAQVARDRQHIRGLEDILLWRHRLQTGVSTEANYGRFYPGYNRPTNRHHVRARKASPLIDNDRAIDFTISRSALQGKGGLLQADWWQRVPLSDPGALAAEPAVYCIYDRDSEEVAYIGETSILTSRAASHGRTEWPFLRPWLAYFLLPSEMPKHVRHELESDLLGWHFWKKGRSPVAQYTRQLHEGQSG